MKSSAYSFSHDRTNPEDGMCRTRPTVRAGAPIGISPPLVHSTWVTFPHLHYVFAFFVPELILPHITVWGDRKHPSEQPIVPKLDFFLFFFSFCPVLQLMNIQTDDMIIGIFRDSITSEARCYFGMIHTLDRYARLFSKENCAAKVLGYCDPPGTLHQPTSMA